MLRIILAGIAAVSIGSLGGLALNRATPEKASIPELQSATIASAVAPPADTSPQRAKEPKRTADVAPAPKRTAEAAPTPKATPAPAALPIPADLLKEKPEIRFDGDRVSVRLGKYKIEF
jgi:hypothetical protein